MLYCVFGVAYILKCVTKKIDDQYMLFAKIDQLGFKNVEEKKCWTGIKHLINIDTYTVHKYSTTHAHYLSNTCPLHIINYN